MSDEQDDDIAITPEMIEAGTRVLNASGAVEYPMGADERLVSDIYRAMVMAQRSDPAAARSW